MKKQWEENANAVEKYYGCFVDWENRYYICPECGECVYECDWTEEKLKEFFCPICEFKEEPEDYYDDDCDYDIGFDPYMGCFTDDC